jgi:hypothetical protein
MVVNDRTGCAHVPLLYRGIQFPSFVCIISRNTTHSSAFTPALPMHLGSFPEEFIPLLPQLLRTLSTPC